MPKFKIKFYRTVPEYAHLEVVAADRDAAVELAEAQDEDKLEWVGGSTPDKRAAEDLEYDVEEVRDAG